MPARNLRMIFSEVSGCSLARATSKSASERSPALPRSLWQPDAVLFHRLRR